MTPAIDNDTEFYPHHYLAEVLDSDLAGIRSKWSEAGAGSPPQRLAALGRDFARIRALADERALGPVEIAAFHAQVIEALGYQRILGHYAVDNLAAGNPGVPTLAQIHLPGRAAPWVVVVGDGFTLKPTDIFTLQAMIALDVERPNPQNSTWNSTIDAIFAGEDPPRFVVYLAGAHIVLLEAAKWAQGRFLRLDLDLAFGRKDTAAFFIAAALMSRDTICPDGDQLLHAFGVTKDLKHGIIKAVELLANCWAKQELARRETQKLKLFDDDDPLGSRTALELKTQCMRYLYRLLFLLYVESHDDLGIVPMNAEAYRRGYSLESLRDLELQPLTSPISRDGTFFQQHLERLFHLVFHGLSHGGQQGLLNAEAAEGGSLIAGFTMPALASELFDPATTPFLNSVELNRQVVNQANYTRGLRIPNHLLQEVIQKLSLTAVAKFGRSRGRISYRTLGIEQLGSVYESLLSYSGFFATETLIELKRKQDATDDPEVQTWFAPESDKDRFHADEIIQEQKDDGRGYRARTIPRGTFVFRLAGRDRTESASFYTPKVLTNALVKYSLMELIGDGIRPRSAPVPVPARVIPKADELLGLTILDSAMGCASFLTEAIDQLAQAYLERKQAETGVRIPQADLDQERARVRHHLAITGCYGVDLNPIAVELAKVSLWLSCIHQGASVPWLGLRLTSANSLIGARRAYYSLDALLDGTWTSTAPTDLDWSKPRPPRTVYHFLIPVPDMLSVATDKVAKELAPEGCAEAKDWKKDVGQKWSTSEVATLLRLSQEVDRLFSLYHLARGAVLSHVTPATRVWSGGTMGDGSTYQPTYRDFGRTGATLDQQRRELETLHATNSAYRRLKLAMDSWTSLWFWPLENAKQLPGRGLWLELLEMCLVDQSQPVAQPSSAAIEATLLNRPVQDTIFFENQPRQQTLAETLLARGEDALLAACSTIVDTKVLAEKRPFFATVMWLAQANRFLHWELAFPEVFAKDGFDLQVGNPPWLKVEWEERSILGDFDPIIGLADMSSSDVAKRRAEILITPERSAIYTSSLSRFSGMQDALNSSISFSILKGVQSNLCKNFMALAWRIGSDKGAISILHQAGVFDDPKGMMLREAAYRRLSLHARFVNEKKLFAEAGNILHFEMSVMAVLPKNRPSFYNIVNLFIPGTIELSMVHDGHGLTPGIKNEQFSWDLRGHSNRLVLIDENILEGFATLLDEPGTSAMHARLPVVHSWEIVNVLRRFTEQPTRLGSISERWAATEFFHERNSQSDGTIKRKTEFPKTLHGLIIQGPHFHVGNPFYQQPMEICNSHRAYEPLELPTLPVDYLPRTNYIPACNQDEYRKRIPTWTRPSTKKEERFDERFRIVYRKMLAITGERTLIPAIVPPNACNIDGAFSVVFESDREMVSFSGLCASIVLDFFIRINGKANLRGDTIGGLPTAQTSIYISKIIARALRLNSLTAHYAPLWASQWIALFATDGFTKTDHRLTHASEQAARASSHPLTYTNGRYTGPLTQPLNLFWSHAAPTWTDHSPLRSDYARRQALVELDALAALAMGLTLDELLTIYRVQFPVLQEYEHNDRYDQLGRKLPIPALRAWEALRDSADRTTTAFTHEGTVFYPPFTGCRREDDMTTAYSHFQRLTESTAVAP
jgi:hypothetical protein